MTGGGREGRRAQAAGHDINYISVTGALAAIGPAEKPVPPLNLVGDFGGGALYVVVGVLAALLEASKSGKGQVVDAAMCDGAASLMSMFFDMAAAGRWTEQRESNFLDGGAKDFCQPPRRHPARAGAALFTHAIGHKGCGDGGYCRADERVEGRKVTDGLRSPDAAQRVALAAWCAADPGSMFSRGWVPALRRTVAVTLHRVPETTGFYAAPLSVSTPRRIWSSSIDSNSALKLPSPKPSSPLRWMNSKKIGPMALPEKICSSTLVWPPSTTPSPSIRMPSRFSRATSSPCFGSRASILSK